MEHNNSRHFRALRFTRNHLVFGLIAFVVMLFAFGQQMIGVAPAQKTSLVVTGSPENFTVEASVLSGDNPRSVMLFVCTGYTCDAQQAAIEEVAGLYAERMKIIRLSPTTIPEITSLVVEALGGEAYPMYYIRTPDGTTQATAGIMTVSELSQFINATIGGPVLQEGATQPGSNMPTLRNVITLTAENLAEVQRRAQDADAVYTIFCGSHDPVCQTQLSVLDAEAANHTNVVFVYLDTEVEDNLNMLIDTAAVLDRLATPAHIITNPQRGMLSWVGFIAPDQLGAFIQDGIDAVPQGTTGGSSTPAPQSTPTQTPTQTGR